MERYSTVSIQKENISKKVRISSPLKPEIQGKLIEKWQSLIDTAARLVHVPSGLIMLLNEKTIEVFLRSNTEGNPYEAGEKADLIYGLYCETVIGTQKRLLVSDARKSDVWSKNNPDIDLNMISYLGYPINWPDGEVFGTVCLLDNKENNYNNDFKDLLYHIKTHLENDLKLLLLNDNLKKKNEELRHLNNTKSRFLSLISHDIRGNIGTIREFVNLIVANYDMFEPGKIKQLLMSLSESATTVNETFENLLNWSKNDIVQIRPEMEPVDIIDLIEKILLYFKQSIQIKNLKIKKSFCSETIFITTDKNMLTVVFRNIISNAIKYNYPNGEISIDVCAVGDKHKIRIEDNGTGMDKRTVEKLFEYNEDHSEGTQGESSAGIGLILCKEFLDKLNGKISVNSVAGKGTAFNIEL